MSLAAKKLLWNDATGIAEALCAAYSDVDRLSINQDDLARMISTLPQFADGPPPSRQALDHVLWTWMRCAGDNGSFGDGA
jgi:FeS assembly protein IscX